MSTLEHIMTKDLQRAQHYSAIREAAQKMREKKIGSLLVEKDGKDIGIITETDIVRKAVAGDLDLKKGTVESIMSSPVLTLDLQRSPQDAHDLMGESGVRHLGVTRNGQIVGILSVRDILIYFRGQSEPKMGID